MMEDLTIIGVCVLVFIVGFILMHIYSTLNGNPYPKVNYEDHVKAIDQGVISSKESYLRGRRDAFKESISGFNSLIFDELSKGEIIRLIELLQNTISKVI